MSTTIAPVRCAAIALLVSTLGLASPAAAQSEDPTEQTAAQELADAPPAGTWSSDVTLGFQIKDGRTETRGYDADLVVAHSTRGGSLIRFEAQASFAQFRPPSGGDFLKVDDKQYLSVNGVRKLSGRVGATVVGSWQRDDPAGLEHRLMAQAGVYVGVVNSPRVQMMVAPLVGLGTQDDARDTDSEGILNIGGMQSLTWHPTGTATVKLTVKGHQDLKESEDFSLALNGSVGAAINSHLGLKLYYKFSSEGIHPQDQAQNQHEVGAGLSITIPGN